MSEEAKTEGTGENPGQLPAKVEGAPEAAALTLADKRDAQVVLAETARVEAVAELLSGAYQQASNLKLTKEESDDLCAPFRDDQVRGGAKDKDNLLYIQHIHVSDRLNRVLGIGQWALVKRSQRAQQVRYTKSEGVRIFFEGVLLIRGCYVGEAIGVGDYHLNNSAEDFGTAMESAMSDCLTRCAKRLGIGSQVWDKTYCETWLSKYAKERPPIMQPQAKREPAAPAAGKATEAEVVPPKSESAPAGTGPGAVPAPAEPPKCKRGRPAGKAASAPADAPQAPAPEAKDPEAAPEPEEVEDYDDIIVKTLLQLANPAKKLVEKRGIKTHSGRVLGSADPKVWAMVDEVKPEDTVRIRSRTYYLPDDQGKLTVGPLYELLSVAKVAEGGQGNG